jgi:outer membrane protein OmpA-like peptidoglycan-associated protein
MGSFCPICGTPFPFARGTAAKFLSASSCLAGASRNRCGMRARGWHGVSFKTDASVPIQQIKPPNSLEQARTPQANNTAVSPAEQPAAAGTLVEESVLKESATAASVVEQPEGVVHENNPEKTDQLRPGRLFACFVLERELGIGTIGALWLAQDYSLGRRTEQVALKFLPDDIARNKTAIKELKDEVCRRIALKHPNILRVHDLVEDKGRVAIQMEYPDGQSLSRLRLTKPNHVFEVRDLAKWVGELCEALEYAHKDIGVINGEIAPGDLIVNAAGNLKLDAFGIANCISDSTSRLTVIHDASHTVAHMSPQRAKGEEPAITDDLYSLGAIIYELLTGKPPLYAGDNGVQVSGKIPPSMTQRRAELGIEGEVIPKNWEETVAACLAKDPSRRPQSASEAAQQLKSASSPSGISAGSTVASLPNSIPKRKTSARTRQALKAWLAIVGILSILALVLALVFSSFHEETEPGLGKTVLNTIPASPHLVRANKAFLTPAPAPTPYPELNPTPSLEKSPTASLEKSPTASLEKGPTPSLEKNPTPSLELSPTPSLEKNPTPSLELSTTPSLELSTPPSLEASTPPSPQEIATSNPRQSAIPSPMLLSQLDLDATKEEVVKRINALPGATAEKKANLIEKMHKARSMERLTVVHFDVGQTSLRRAATDPLVKAFDSPAMRDKLSDPTIILVVAGYADAGGNVDLNLRFSKERAEKVSKILKERVGLLNAIQTIGMGGTELLDNKRPDQNRAVEVWAVLPL